MVSEETSENFVKTGKESNGSKLGRVGLVTIYKGKRFFEKKESVIVHPRLGDGFESETIVEDCSQYAAIQSL